MRLNLVLAGIASLAIPVAAHAGNQSSNSSSNSSSNNGVIRERTINRYCENGVCVETMSRGVYRDESRKFIRYRDPERNWRSRADRTDDDDD